MAITKMDGEQRTLLAESGEHDPREGDEVMLESSLLQKER
jgi:hypothetical protein